MGQLPAYPFLVHTFYVGRLLRRSAPFHCPITTVAASGNGNMVTRTTSGVTYTLTYDAEGHMIGLENNLSTNDPNYIKNRYVLRW